jgi:hypothetical protein
MLNESANDAFRFSNITGMELSRLLSERVAERLPALTGQDHLQAVLGAALVTLADVLQGPVRATPDPRKTAERMIQLSADWLRRLLEPAFTDSGNTSVEPAAAPDRPGT